MRRRKKRTSTVKKVARMIMPIIIVVGCYVQWQLEFAV